MSYSTDEIIEQTKVALAYLEDGARETGVKKLAEVVARSHSYWPLVNLKTGHEAVAIGSALVEGYTRLRPSEEEGVYLADDDSEWVGCSDSIWRPRPVVREEVPA
jgi:hypothetical protein